MMTMKKKTTMTPSKSSRHELKHKIVLIELSDSSVASTSSSGSTSDTIIVYNSNSNSVYKLQQCCWNKRHSIALIFGQMCFGAGSVITALGLPAINPFVFALYREVAASIILIICSYALEYNSMISAGILLLSSRKTTTTTPRMLLQLLQRYRSDMIRFLILGLCVYGNQACFISGIKLAGPVTGSVYQPSQPLMTAFLNMFLFQQEPINSNRIAGILIAFVGCTIMVIWSTTTTASKATSSSSITLEKL